MKTNTILIFLASFLLIQCKVKVKTTSVDLSKQQVLDAEKAFEQMTAEKGWAESFYFYADSNAVLETRDSLVMGKEKIRTYFQSRPFQNVSLKWDADFVDVASSGDLAYTYGKYTFTAIDTAGKPVDNQGIFHTVWKKQSDGSWKFVWD